MGLCFQTRRKLKPVLKIWLPPLSSPNVFCLPLSFANTLYLSVFFIISIKMVFPVGVLLIVHKQISIDCWFVRSHLYIYIYICNYVFLRALKQIQWVTARDRKGGERFELVSCVVVYIYNIVHVYQLWCTYKWMCVCMCVCMRIAMRFVIENKYTKEKLQKHRLKFLLNPVKWK